MIVKELGTVVLSLGYILKESELRKWVAEQTDSYPDKRERERV